MSNVNKPDSSHLSYPDFMAVMEDSDGSDAFTGYIGFYIADLIAWLLSPPNECSRSAKEAYYDCVIARPFLRKVIPNNKEHVFSSFVHTMHEDRSQEEAEFAETHCIHCGAKWRKS